MAPINVKAELQAAIDKVGSQKAFALASGVSPQYVNDVLQGHRLAGDKLLDALGLERVVTIRRKGEK